MKFRYLKWVMVCNTPGCKSRQFARLDNRDVQCKRCQKVLIDPRLPVIPQTRQLGKIGPFKGGY